MANGPWSGLLLASGPRPQALVPIELSMWISRTAHLKKAHNTQSCNTAEPAVPGRAAAEITPDDKRLCHAAPRELRNSHLENTMNAGGGRPAAFQPWAHSGAAR
jgi:hypothetical protein